MKRYIGILTVILTLISVISLTAFATEELVFGDYKYIVLENGTVEIKDYTGTDDKLVIPAEIDGKKVTSLSDRSFDKITATEVVVPSSVEYIGMEAFGGSENLRNVVLNEGLKKIDEGAFWGCYAIEKINFPDTLEEMGYFVLASAAKNITELVIPGGIKDYKGVFYEEYAIAKPWSMLQKIVFKEGVEKMYADNSSAYALRYIYVPSTAKNFTMSSFVKGKAFEAVIYNGTEQQWSEVELNDKLKGFVADGTVKIHFVKEHKIESKYLTAPTCGQDGYTAGEYCATCDAWISGHEVIKSYYGHSYVNSYIDSDTAYGEGMGTVAATFNSDGYEELTCRHCFNDINEVIYKVDKITVPNSNSAYTGKIFRPSFKVTDRMGNDITSNFKVYYLNEDTVPGFYLMNVLNIGRRYDASQSFTYTISPYLTKDCKASPTDTSVTLTWSTVKHASGYRIYHKQAGKWVGITNVTGNSYTVKNLTPCTNYTFAVRAYMKTTNSVIYMPTFITLTATTKLSTSTLKVASTAKGRATLAWENIDGETGYQIWYFKKGDTKYTKLGNFKADTTKTYATGLKSGTTYAFRVRAYAKVGNSYVYSAFSDAKAVKIK